MAKQIGEGKADHDPGEVIQVATELMETDRARDEQPDLRAIGAELGVPGGYVDKAVIEIDRRRMRRRRSTAGVVVLAVALLVAGMAAWRSSSASKAGAPVAAASPGSVRGLAVAFDVGHGHGAAGGASELETQGASVVVLEHALTDASLKGVDALVLLGARKPFENAELDAVTQFVRGGGGLVVADIGWEWVAYVKKPLAEMPANVLGGRLGFGFTKDSIGLPARFDPRDLGGITTIARVTPWAPGGFSIPSDGRVLVRDDKLRPLVAVMAVDKGHVALFGHAGMLAENPALFVLGVALAAGR